LIDIYLKSKINFLYWRICEFLKDINVIEYSISKPFINHTPSFSDDRINKSYKHDNLYWEHAQYIIAVQNATIDPISRFVIVGYRNIVKQSISHDKLVPSSLRFLKSLLKTNPKFEEALLFDGQSGVNYYHFFTDTINKLWVFEKYLNYKLPLLISRENFDSIYFQDILKVTFLKDFNWIVLEPDQYVKVKKLFIVKPRPYNIELWKKTLGLFENYIKPNRKRKVFLNRSKGRGRFISNFIELEPILKKYNFEVIDTDGFSLLDQISLFSETDFLVGIHGAGLTNCMFSYKNKLRMIEINPPNRIACQYYWLADIFDYRYNCILGDIEEQLDKSLLMSNGLTLSPQKLEEAILKFELP
jgi:hypothetical protein